MTTYKDWRTDALRSKFYNMVMEFAMEEECTAEEMLDALTFTEVHITDEMYQDED